MTPHKDGKANRGHSCVKGRFAFGYATHRDRITSPMIRERIDEPWREVSWEEAIAFAAARLRAIQEEHGRNSIGAITSSRCTNEEIYLVQKLVRAAFGNNNIDTCARVCHSPTGYGLKTTLGESAGTQAFDSVDDADVIVVIGANPTDAHPVFASRLKRRLRQGAQLIVIDPRRIDLVDGAACARRRTTCSCSPAPTWPCVNALAHVIVTEGLEDQAFVAGALRTGRVGSAGANSSRDPSTRPRPRRSSPALPAEALRAAARLYATGGNAAIYYGLGVTEHSQGSTMVMGIANLAMAHRQHRPRRRRRESAARPEQRAGLLRHGLVPARAARLPPRLGRPRCARSSSSAWSVDARRRTGPAHPEHVRRRASTGSFRALYCQGEDIAQSDPNTQHVEAALRALDCLVVQDLFLNETAKYAHVFLPGASFLEKDGTFTNAERRISPRAPGDAAAGGQGGLGGHAWRWPTRWATRCTTGTPAQIMDEIARADADLRRRELRAARRAGQRPVAVQRSGAGGHADHARRSLRARQGTVRC